MNESIVPPADSDREIRNHGLGPRASPLIEEAGRAIEQRRLADAERAVAGAEALIPNHPEVLRLRAVLHHMHQRYAQAAALLKQAADMRPDDALIQNNLGSALGESGNIEGAIAAFRRSTELAPNIAAAWFNLGKVLAEQSWPHEAREALDHAIEINSDYLMARIMRAQIWRSLGRTETAAEEYREVLARNRNYLPALGGLTSLKTVKLSDEEIRSLGRIYMRHDLTDKDRANVGFALMDALDSRGREREAFAVAASANATRRRQLEWNAPLFAQRMQAIAAAFVTPARTSAAPTQGHEVIFIVSMPRSGSTLTEQILAAHPQVEGANELEVLPHLINDESKKRGLDFPFWVPRASPQDWERLGKTYLEQTARWRTKRPRFTDKGLSNWQFAGAIRAMLPGARIVNVRRDPVETCLSCFRQAFATGQAYTYDMDELAAFWRDYDGQTRIWEQRIPSHFHTFVYESLLADPEGEIRRLLDFCDLPFDEACLRSHEIERNVRTASASQVREPLRKDTARAARYGELLAPLRRALGIA